LSTVNSDSKFKNKIVEFIKEPLVLSTLIMVTYGVVLFELIYPLNRSFLLGIGLPIIVILFIDFFIKFGCMAILCLWIFPIILKKSGNDGEIKSKAYKKENNILAQNTNSKETFLLGLISFLLQLITFLIFSFAFGILSVNFGPLLEHPLIGSEIPAGWFLFVIALLPGIFEELLFREYIMRLQLTKYSIRFAIISNGIFFAIFHIFGRLNDPLGAIFGMIFVALPYGMALSYLRITSKSLIPCIIMHYLTDSLLLFLLSGMFSFEGNPLGLILTFILGFTVVPSILIIFFLSTYTKVKGRKF